MIIETRRLRAWARVNWGRWVVDCPVCPDALMMGPGTRLFQCWECGAEADVVWPVNTAGIDRMLALRPMPNTRNWQPGETLHDLAVENLLHGIGPALPGEELLIVGDRIITDTLPTRPVGRRLQIGA